MLQLDVIEPVDEPTEWCSPIVVVPKADGRVRICVDLTKLNQAVRREVYQMPTIWRRRRRSPYETYLKGECMGLGPNPTRSVQEAKSGHGIWASSRTVRSGRGDNCLSRCKQFWTRCGSYAKTTIWRFETSGVRQQIYDRD